MLYKLCSSLTTISFQKEQVNVVSSVGGLKIHCHRFLQM